MKRWFLFLIFVISLATLTSCAAIQDMLPFGGDDDQAVEDEQGNNAGGVCLHEWEDVVADEYLKTPATCSSAALYNQKCKHCGIAGGKPFASGSIADHLFSEIPEDKYLVSSATCSSAAVYNKSCAYCGEKSEETFTHGATTPHNRQDKATVETFAASSDCSHGNLYYYSCATCGVLFEDTFEFGPKKKHQDSHGDYICDNCGAAMKVWTDDPSVDNITDKHEFGKN